jgi:hypothetical protein
VFGPRKMNRLSNGILEGERHTWRMKRFSSDIV